MNKIKALFIKICLYFCRINIGVDYGSHDKDYYIVSKRFMGKTYIIEEGEL